MLTFNDLLTPESLSQEYLSWCMKYGNSRDRGDLRFGQYICNKYLCLGKSTPEIFYEEDVGKAYYMIVDVLINQES